MLDKKQRTIEDYKRIGAEFRAFKSMASKLSIDVAKVIPKAEWRKLQNAVDTISRMSSSVENRMFKDYPELSDDYINVFYGSTNVSDRSVIDGEVIAKAKEFCDSLF